MSASVGRRGSGSGSLAASYASRSHREQQEEQAAIEQGSSSVSTSSSSVAAEKMFPVRLPTHPGLEHVPLNLTNGMVVDPSDKVNTTIIFTRPSIYFVSQ